jgi:hypothetical protein
VRDGEEFDRVEPGQVGDGNQATLLPQQPIRKLRDIAHMDATAYDAAALAHRLQRLRH